MSELVCPQCGAPLDPNATECKYCGEKLATQQAAQQVNQPQYQQPQYQQPQYQQPQYQQPQYQQPPYQQPVYQQPVYVQPAQPAYVTAINPAWPVKSKTVAGVLGILLGGFGIHKFYLGKVGMGVLYLLFCWTYIPAVVGFIEGIVYLCSNDQNFQLKNHVRLQ